jgi:uncharacterized protein (DUF1800 family)
MFHGELGRSRYSLSMDARTRMAHLLRRAGFGPAPGEVERRLNVGYEATVHALVESGNEPDDLADVDAQIGGILDLSNIDDVRTWWTYRMIHSNRPFVEKMTLFWHGHFATAVAKVGNPYLMYQQNQLFRTHGLTEFEELLARLSRDPAMLVYLDGAANRKAHPNENYAREIMELFTTGLGVYTERDVLDAARAFTGWNLKDDAFAFNPAEHDDGAKEFLGRKGPLDGNDIIHVLAEHPATAERLTRRLYTYLVHDDPDARTLAPFVARWKESKGNVREVVRAIFLSPAFSSDRAYRARIKSPAEFVIGAIRSLGGTIAPRQVVGLMARMGQDLFNPPSVKGWDGGLAWMSSSAMFERFNFAASITTARGPMGTSHINPEAAFDGVEATSEKQLLELATRHLLDGRLAPGAQAAILAYLETGDPSGPKDGKGRLLSPLEDKRALDEKTRGLLHLILSTPEYQLS